MTAVNNLQTFIDNRIPKDIEFETSVDSTEASHFIRSLRRAEKNVLKVAMRHGGYVAGGCPRYVCETVDHTRKYDEIDAHAYRQFGDIDIFFPTKDAFFETYKELRHGKTPLAITAAKVEGTVIEDDEYLIDESEAHFASNVSITARADDSPHIRNIPIQLIKCQFGDPRTVLSKFDFLNSMVAFAMEEGKIRTIRPKAWLENERSNSLNVLVWDSPLSFYRINKYISKYGYERLVDGNRSEDRVMSDMLKTMESLPSDPNTAGNVWRKSKNTIDGSIIFTQQNYAWHISRVLTERGHVFSPELAVFMVTMCMMTGVLNDKTGPMTIKHIEKRRESWDPTKVEARVASWKEAQRKALEAKLRKKERNEELYDFTTGR